MPAAADVLSAAIRALSFLAVFQAAGMAIFLALFGHLLTASNAIVRRRGLATALAAIVLVILQYTLEAARMSGELSGALDPSLQSLVLHSATATAFTWRLTALALLAFGLRADALPARVLSLIGAILLVCSFALVGHTSAHPQRWALSVLLIVHLAIVAFWFGALVPLSVASRRERASSAAVVTEAFSRIALVIVPILLAAGLILAGVILGGLSGLSTTYGQLLIVKLVGFALLMGLAALNKWHLGPRLATGDEGIGIALRRSLRAEYGLIAAILAVTAVLTSFYSPD